MGTNAAENNEVHDGLSEDGKTYTRLVRDDDKNINNEIVDDNDNLNNDDILGKVDVSTFPEEQRPIITKLLDGFKALSSENSTLKEKAGLAEVLEKTVAQLNQQRADNGQQPVKKSEIVKLSDQLKFAENDYYAPFFKQIAEAIDGIKETVVSFDGKINETKQTSFEDRVTNFVKTNKIPLPVIKQMDEIARTMGRGVYNDLERLHKLAKTELGIKDNVVPIRQDNGATGKKINNAVNMGGVRKQNNTSTKPVSTMADAFAKAEQDLSEDND